MQNVNKEKQPSYYAVIPATVRYDERLKYAERLLYGEITSLIGEGGYCFAQNSYFSDLYKVIPGTISRWISHLKELGYIKVELIRNEKNEIIERRIYITDMSYRQIVSNTYKQKKQYPYGQKEQYPISSKAKDNNINIKIDRFFIYIINNKGEFPREFKNMEQFEEFYRIIERFELNYTEEILRSFKEENIEKLKFVIYAIKEIFIRNRKNLLIKATRENFFEVYDNCKVFEQSYENTINEIKNFFDYYYASIIKKLEASK